MRVSEMLYAEFEDTHGSGSHALIRIVLSSGRDILKLMSSCSHKICNLARLCVPAPVSSLI